jgi:hypothetical protein
MIDERFSAAAFAARGLNTKQSLELAYELKDEIQAELHAVITDRLTEILQRLSEMGHDLKPCDPLVPAHLAYRDDEEDEAGYRCKLRVAVDTGISTGYSHLSTDHPSDDLDVDWFNPDNWPDNETVERKDGV